MRCSEHLPHDCRGTHRWFDDGVQQGGKRVIPVAHANNRARRKAQNIGPFAGCFKVDENERPIRWLLAMPQLPRVDRELGYVRQF